MSYGENIKTSAVLNQEGVKSILNKKNISYREYNPITLKETPLKLKKGVLELDEKKNLKLSQTQKQTYPEEKSEKGSARKVESKTTIGATSKNEISICKKIRKKIGKFIESSIVTIFMLLITLFVLFASDVRYAFLKKSVDLTFEILSTVFFGFFCLEIILASISLDNYIFSFFFWLDFISTVSLIQEISFIFDPLIDSFSGTSSDSKGTAQTIAKAASAGRITRVLRIVRIIRLIRIVKLYKSTMQARNQIQKKKKDRLIKQNIQQPHVIHNNNNDKDDMLDNPAFKDYNDKIKSSHKPKSSYHINNYLEEHAYNEVDFGTNDRLKNDRDRDRNDLDGENLLSKNNDIKTFRVDTVDNELNVEENHIENNLKEAPFNTMIGFKGNKKIEGEILIVEQEKSIIQTEHIKTTNMKTDKTDNKNLYNTEIQTLSPEIKVQQKKKPDEDEDIIKESNISKLLTDSITKKLIILILGMVLGLTIISEDMWVDEPYYYYSSSAHLYQDLNLMEPYQEGISTYKLEQQYFAHSSNIGDITFYHAKIDPKDLNHSLVKNLTMEIDKKVDPNSIYWNYPLPENRETDETKQMLKELLGPESTIVELDGLLYLTSPKYNLTDSIYIGPLTAVNNKIKYLNFAFIRLILYQSNDVFPILNITYKDQLIYINSTASNYDYRKDDVAFTFSRNRDFLVSVSRLHDTQLTGLLNIIKTIFITILIVVGAVVFENDTKTLVLNPLEIMVEIVEMVERDPIIAKNVENLQMGVKNLANKAEENEGKNDEKKKKNKTKKLQENTEKYEVKMIQNSIVKISGLLAICFGDAGGDIIKKNLEKGKDLNAMLPGEKKMAIFGFCDIRQFADVNDALQERTMIFVNQISEIVHSSVDRFSGSTNKNIGDAYLSAWRFIKKEESEDNDFPVVKEVKVKINDPDTMKIADQSILGFLHIIIRINTNYDVLSYRDDKEIKRHKDLQKYEVKMGFGLHLGWGIEGAIGSTYKIDASYLSPNVNISARLEAATKQYGVSLLVSGELYDHCSHKIQKLCRLVDVVAVKGSIKPIRLYTIDVNIHKLQKEKQNTVTSVKKRYAKLIEDKEKMHLEAKNNAGGDIVSYVLEHHNFKRLITLNRHKDFLQTYNMAIQAYIEGSWKKSGQLYEKVLELDPNDGPSKTLYEFIKGENFTAPSDWNGSRSLSSK